MAAHPDDDDDDGHEISINKHSREWRLSPPPLKRRRRQTNPLQPAITEPTSSPTPTEKQPAATDSKPNPPSRSAHIEAGTVAITNHSHHFSTLLSAATPDPYPSGCPRLPIQSYRALFDSCLDSPRGAHFVIHQHDHPVAGTHYDLRLQINPTSSASWALMYGPPGDPNSPRRGGRNATETRVHCLWNHLIETATADTGSLLIWDTGTYRVLPPRERQTAAAAAKSAPPVGQMSEGDDDDDDDDDDDSAADDGNDTLTEQQKLRAAFAARKIRLSLEGTRLPRPYVVYMRLSIDDDIAGRARAAKAASSSSAAARRGRRRAGRAAAATSPGRETSGKRNGAGLLSGDGSGVSSADDEEAGGVKPKGREGGSVTTKSPSEEASREEMRKLEEDGVRRANAYQGASNTIGSIHQRRWFMSMDRAGCGFTRKVVKHGGTAPTTSVVWESGQQDGLPTAPGDSGGQGSDCRLRYPFYVRGPDHERSVVTGRLAADILRDEKVEGFVKRKGWRPVVK